MQSQHKKAYLLFLTKTSPECDELRYGGNEFGTRPEEKHEWRFGRGHNSETDEYPHGIFFSMPGLTPDESTRSKIARSELLMLINVLMSRMKWIPLALNDVYPVS